ncbi:MAG: amidase family protein [Gammaproteobacteria bacterium]|nr:amidase family protein [Gammaproteobacteria bacterium]MDH4256365.1 amidase family protein [Gammaproteobacteria bacterium]MDH5311796.1 amidase family protein [Gammaproteobacteria bacterium]
MRQDGCWTRIACAVAALACVAPLRAAELDLTSATVQELNVAMDAGALDSVTLVQRYLARIEAFDRQGPGLNAVLTLNSKALDEARALDRERATRGRRSPLHGIPVVLKDNIDTADLPTTAGSFMLKGSIPPDDAFLVRRLRDAGAIILAKLNMSEFASGDAMNSLGGATYNPHDPRRTPSGSSGGTGAAIAAAYASIGLGTDTGGSVRGPSSANGIVGLKPTLGLISRDGIIPLALSFDTAGPMARSVYDVAAALGVLAGIDPADPATARANGRIEQDYTNFLDAGALKGARIGIARDFMKSDEEVDWVIEASLQAMRDSGAELVDIELPSWLMDARGRFYRAIRYREFRAQIEDYLATTGPDYPKTLKELIRRSMALTASRDDGVIPNPSRWQLMMKEEDSGELTDYEYVAVRDHALPLLRGIVGGIMESEKLDAIVYPTSHVRPERVDPDPDPEGAPGSGGSPVILANLTGFPDLIVPAGFTGRGLPVTISFLGPAFSEPRLLALGYAFEQKTRARRLPVSTPPLAGERVSY